MDYTIYKTATGEILRRVSKPAADGDPRLRSGEGFVPGIHNEVKYNIIGGVPVLKALPLGVVIDKVSMSVVVEYAKITN